MKKTLLFVFLLFGTLLWGQTNQLTPETAAQLAAGKETVAILDLKVEALAKWKHKP